MRNLPYIRKSLFMYGIRPLQNCRLIKIKDYDEKAKYNIVGFDTESVADNTHAHQLYTTQIFYKPSSTSNVKCDVHIKPLRGIARLEDFPQKSLIFAHNLEFDLTNLLGNDLKNFNSKDIYKGWKGFFVFGQSTSLARFTNKELNYDLKFIDTLNYYSGSLEYVADTELNTKKLDKPSYLGYREPTKEEMPYFLKYAIKDAELCYLLGLNIYDNYFTPPKAFAYTKAGLSVKAFRSNFLLKPFLLPQRKDIYFIWNSYNGARFESYGRGFFKNVSIFDINSLYPYAATFPMPFNSNEMLTLTLEQYEKNKYNFVGWCNISGKYLDKTPYPLIPQRTSKLYFPLSFDNTYLTTYELEPALNDIDIWQSDIRGFFPTDYDINHPIKQYVEHYYANKENLDKIKAERPLTPSENGLRDFYKAMVNHLYGKTGEKHLTISSTGRKLLLSGRFFNPFVCSLITGKSRAVLGEYVSKYNALYADTDSVVTTQQIPTNTKLGGFKLEGKGDILLIRPKLYFVLKDGEVTKYARHSFRIKFKDLKDDKKKYGKLLYEYITKFKNSKYIPYHIERITKFKESVKRDLALLSNTTMDIKVTLSEDNRRYYLEHYNTLEELLTNSTLSDPVKKAMY